MTDYELFESLVVRTSYLLFQRKDRFYSFKTKKNDRKDEDSHEPDKHHKDSDGNNIENQFYRE